VTAPSAPQEALAGALAWPPWIGTLEADEVNAVLKLSLLLVAVAVMWWTPGGRTVQKALPDGPTRVPLMNRVQEALVDG